MFQTYNLTTPINQYDFQLPITNIKSDNDDLIIVFGHQKFTILNVNSLRNLNLQRVKYMTNNLESYFTIACVKAT